MGTMLEHLPPGVSYLEMKSETNENFPFLFVDDYSDLSLGAFLSTDWLFWE